MTMIMLAIGFLIGWVCGLIARAPWFIRRAALRGAPAGFEDVVAECPGSYVGFTLTAYDEPEWRVHDVGLGAGSVTAKTAEMVIARAKALRVARGPE